jgi:hypothetical protein
MKTKIQIINEATRSRAIEAIRSLSFDEPHEMTIRPKKSKRSHQANALYWVWIDRIRLHVMDSTGQAYSADAMHEWLKAKFLPTITVEVNGEVHRCRLSTASLKVDEMSEYMESIDRFCVQSLGLYLPTPGVDDG